MDNKFNIRIPKPCHEDWNAMTPDETGRFCMSCAKSVVDFTDKSTEEIRQYFFENSGTKVCGRFKTNQMGKVPIPIPRSVLQQPMPFHKAFLLILFIVMGSTLFSCKNHNDEFVTGEPAVVENDTIENRAILGAIVPRKTSDTVVSTKNDSVKNRVIPIDYPVITGEVALPDDTPPPSKPEFKSLYTPTEVEILPNYPGGIRQFYDYVKANFKKSDADKNTTAKIIVSFIVEKDGSLSTIKILRSPNATLGTETTRVLEASPKWIPGEMNGEKVRVQYSLPIQIKPE